MRQITIKKLIFNRREHTQITSDKLSEEEDKTESTIKTKPTINMDDLTMETDYCKYDFGSNDDIEKISYQLSKLGDNNILKGKTFSVSWAGEGFCYKDPKTDLDPYNLLGHLSTLKKYGATITGLKLEFKTISGIKNLSICDGCTLGNKGKWKSYW